MRALLRPCGILLADLSRHQCRWPVNRANIGELHLFCGEAVQSGYPYCEEHCRKAYAGCHFKGALRGTAG
nr:GcrA family cell cycle regulator [Brucella tritici]